MLAMNNDYLDVFMPTQDIHEAIVPSAIIMGVGFAFAMVVGLWLTSGMPGFPDLSYKAHERWVKVFAVMIAIGGVAMVGGGITSIVIINAVSTKISEVRDNMNHNVKQKYGYDLSAPKSLPMSADRDDALPYSLAITPEGGSAAIYKTFMIRFDRETNEPFISDVETPDAAELEESVKK